MREIKVGNVYKHFKNKYYIVLDIVNDCESNNDEEYKKIIIYKALYGEFLTWARPYEMFASEVDREKYPDIKQKYRFEEVKIENDKLSLLQKHIQDHNEIVNSKAKELSKCINLLPIREIYSQIKKDNKDCSLDEILYMVYQNSDLKQYSFDKARELILEANDIDEFEYYTKNVRQDLKDYIAEHIFPEYEKNDGGHNIAHILEVIRRSFALNDTFKLGLDDNMIYAIASCHDWGKYEDHSIHHLIAARNFMNDEGMDKFFTPEEKQIINEAIEDHRSSKEDEPRSVYGKLISSADRNTRIEIVFIRSFFVAHERMPETNIEEYLDYTIKRLSKKYDEENPENMFFEDETYKVFIQDMRNLLKKDEEFKNRYCEVNHITSREHRVKDEQGEISYTKVLRKK